MERLKKWGRALRGWLRKHLRIALALILPFLPLMILCIILGDTFKGAWDGLRNGWEREWEGTRELWAFIRRVWNAKNGTL